MLVLLMRVMINSVYLALLALYLISVFRTKADELSLQGRRARCLLKGSSELPSHEEDFSAGAKRLLCSLGKGELVVVTDISWETKF